MGLYEAFGDRTFTLQDFANQTQQQYHSMEYYLRMLVDRGLVACERRNGNPNIYKLTIDRETHPEYFGESSIAMSVTQERVNVPMAASGAPRTAAVG